jgi:nicotinamide-nucleotide amidase
MSAQAVFDALKARSLTLAAAESCTGGMVAVAMTDIAGSSEVFERGFVTYSNAAKSDMLDIPAVLIDRHGAVSREVAEAMATGAVARSRADIAIAITGVAGPGGGSDLKPVGLVHFACATRGGAVFHVVENFGDKGRERVREAARDSALRLVLRVVQDFPVAGQ